MTISFAGILLALLFIGAILAIIALFLRLTRRFDVINREVAQQLGQMSNDINVHLRDSVKIMQSSHQQLDQRLTGATTVFGEVKEQLGRLEATNKQIYEVGKNISSLQDLLRAPKLRGGLGEYILEDLLKQIIPAEHYDIQYQFKNGQRVDAVIRFGKKMVPIDAKFPLENFKRLAEAQTDEEQRQWRKAFLSDVKTHIKSIAEKYILPDEDTFDFALMYIPAENVYYEIFIKDEKLGEGSSVFQYAIERKVIPVSPNSFYAYLRVILLGLRGMVVESRAKEIIVSLSQISGDMDKFARDFELIGRHIGNAQSSYINSEKRLLKLTGRLASIDSADKEHEEIERPVNERLTT